MEELIKQLSKAITDRNASERQVEDYEKRLKNEKDRLKNLKDEIKDLKKELGIDDE